VSPEACLARFKLWISIHDIHSNNFVTHILCADFRLNTPNFDGSAVAEDGLIVLVHDTLHRKIWTYSSI
jgi:hypothetical protein